MSSARRQTGCAVEVILVDDGTNRPESHAILESARPLADRYIEQPNRGLAAARNTGFRAASCDVVIPLDADDLLDRSFAPTCLDALAAHPEAAFAYSDYRVLGDAKYVERLGDYNLYELLDRNVLTYAAAIRRRDWEESGGYDESMTSGYEDWEFWLRLGERGRFGQHVNRVLFRYRKHGPSLTDVALARHGEIVKYIRQKHPGLYEDQARARIKSRWSPAVSIAGLEGRTERQTIRDWAPVDAADDAAARGSAFLVAGSAQRLSADSGELAALAVWGGRQHLELPDGSVALSRAAFFKGTARTRPKSPQRHVASYGPFERLRRHLWNAGLLSLRTWTEHPLRSAGRLIPLRLKERVNQLAGRQLFDLTFYLQFRPAAIHAASAIRQPLCYLPEAPTRKRVAFVTPHLGPGGAESVLLDIAATLDRGRYESFLLATQSQDDGWRKRWEEAVDHVYDLQELVGFDKAGAAIYSIAVNWRVETLLVQNSLAGYGILPHLKARFPSLRTIDLIHSVDEDWDLVSATRDVARSLDVRVAISETVRSRLRQDGTPEARIRLIRNGVDLQRFTPRRAAAADGLHRILFAGRLDAVKRPLLVPQIAEALRKRRGRDDFRFVIAGDGPERASLIARVRSRGLETLFDFRGQVPDTAPLLGDCELVILPSKAEGIPLIVLEAFASLRTVVASAVGGVPEVVTPETGVAIPCGSQEVRQFADALHELMEQPDLRDARAEKGRNLVERLFDRQQFAGAYRELFA